MDVTCDVLKSKKVSATHPIMDNKTQDEEVSEVVERLIGAQRVSAVDADSPLNIDTSKLNLHDNKKDFLKEQGTVFAVIKNLEEVLQRLVPEDEDPGQAKIISRLEASVDVWTIRRQKRNITADIRELVMRNHVQSGFQTNAIAVIAKMIEGYRARLEDLKDQEAEFWAVKNRPPNYYARTIALRLARLYANEKGKIPTVGTSRDGGHPSTDYCRALEEIFAILDINAKVPQPASWAVSQLTRIDLVHPKNRGRRRSIPPQLSPNFPQA